MLWGNSIKEKIKSMRTDQLKQELANNGVDITSRQVKGRLRAANRQAQKEVNARFQTGQREEVTRRIRSMLALLAVFFVAGFLLLGNIANIIMFPISEFVAVYRGIMAFEAHEYIAAFNAATIVIGYVVLLFVKNVLRDNLPDDRHPGLTLRRSVMGLLYFLGITEQQRTLSLSEQLYVSAKGTILFIQISIVLFGFLGRTSDSLISGEPIGIVEVIGYSGTLVLTIALLAVTDITILFIYSVFVNNVGSLDLSANDKGAMMDFLLDRQEVLQEEVLNDLLIMSKARRQSDNLLK